MKPFFQNFEVLTQCCDVINIKLARKKIQTGICCTNGDRKMKIKNKKNFKVRYLFMKLFSRNLKILAPCCNVIIPKLGQKYSSLYIIQLAVKILKSGKIRNTLIITGKLPIDCWFIMYKFRSFLTQFCVKT